MSNQDTNNLFGPISLNAIHVAEGGTSGTTVSFNDAIIRNGVDGVAIPSGSIHYILNHFVASPGDLNNSATSSPTKGIDLCKLTGDFFILGQPQLPQSATDGQAQIGAWSNVVGLNTILGSAETGATALFGSDVTISAFEGSGSNDSLNHGYFMAAVVDNGFVISGNLSGKIFIYVPEWISGGQFIDYASPGSAINAWKKFGQATQGMEFSDQGGPTCMHQDQNFLGYIVNSDPVSGLSSTGWYVYTYYLSLGPSGSFSSNQRMTTTQVGNEIGTSNGWNSNYTVWPEAIAVYTKPANAGANEGQLSGNGGGLNTDWIAVGLCRGSGTNPTGPSMVGLFSKRLSSSSLGTGFIIDGANYNYDDDDNFGINVTMSNNYLVIMSTSYSTSFTRNHFTVFDISGEEPVFKYRRDNPYGGNGEPGFGRNESYYDTAVSKHFTRTMSISGDTRSTSAIPNTSIAAIGPSGHGPWLLIGNPQRFSQYTDAGNVYVFHLPSGTWISSWGLFEYDTAQSTSYNEFGARYGAWVAAGRLQAGRSGLLGPDVIMVSAPGAPGAASGSSIGTGSSDGTAFIAPDINPET